MKENKYLKWLLIVQSFLPLFFLVIIRCYNKIRGKMILDFILELFHGNHGVIGSALKHPEIYATSLLCFCAIMFVFGLLVYFFFKKSQSFGFREEGKKIIIDADVTENSVTFFVTYITPLVLDDIDEGRGFFSFITIAALLILLMRNTNLYYQNPFLTILGYRSFYFHFEGEDGMGNIAITRGDFDTSKLIKRKRISDNEYATKTWRGSGDSKMSSDIKNWKQRVTPVDSEDWKNFITGACMGNYNGQDTTIKILKPVLYYYYVITNCSPINQVNVSFDVDHIIPKERFVGNNMVAQTYRDSLINLALLPTKDNISKKAKALNEITDSWLKLQISTYTGIKEAEFEQYSDIANISLLYNARSKLFTIAFTSNRTTALSK